MHLRQCPWSLALASSIPVLGLESVCPRKGCPLPRTFFVSLALASSLVSSTPPLPNSLIAFWVKARLKFRLVGCIALHVLVSFATSWLCEAGFSAVAVIKSKYRNRIDIEREMHVAISNIEPRFDKMCLEQQAHISH